MDRVIEVLGERIIDDADQRAEIVGKGEGDADVRMGVHEVCGAVDGVDDEGGGRGEVAGGGGFFAEEAERIETLAEG